MRLSEQETTIAYTAADTIIEAFTCLPRDLRKFQKDKRWTEVDSGVYSDGTQWGKFTTPAQGFNPVKAAKSVREITQEQREKSAARLAAARQARQDSGEVEG